MTRSALLTLVVGLALGSPARAGSPVSLGKLKELHRARAEQLRSVLIEETVEQTLPENEALAERVRERILQRRDLPLARLLERFDEQGLSPDQLDRAACELLDQLGDLERKAEDAATVIRVNRHRRVNQRIVIDFAGKRMRIERSDARDLDRLMREHGIPESARRNLHVSSTYIATPDYRIQINERTRTAAFLPVGRVRLHDELERLGIVPEAYFSGRYPTEIRVQPDGAVRIRMRYENRDQIAVELHLRPAPGYEATYFVRYNREGKKLHEFRLSDFRPIDAGFMVPMRAETFQRAGGPDGARSETHVLKTIRWNPLIEESTFVVPTGLRMLPVDADSWRGYQSKAPAMPAGGP